MSLSNLRISANTYPALGYVVAVSTTLLALLATYVIREIWIGSDRQFVSYSVLMLAIAVTAWYGGLGPGLVATALSVFLALFVLILPVTPNALTVSTTQAGLTLFVLSALTISALSYSRARAERLLSAQRSELKVTLESIGDGVITSDAAGNVTFLNTVAEKLTGWDNAAALGKPLTQVFHIINEETRAVVENPAEKALRDGVVVGLANHTCLIARDNSERPIDDSAAPIRQGDGKIVGVVLVFRDVSGRRQVERERTRLLAEAQQARDAAEVARSRVAFLADASAVLSPTLDLQSTLSSLARLVVPFIADWCTVDVFDDSGELQQMGLAHVDPAKEPLVADLRRLYPLRDDTPNGILQVIKSGQSVFQPVVDDAIFQRITGSDGRGDLLKQLGLESWIATPLENNGRILGVLTLVAAQSGRHYTADDMSLAQDLARRAAVAIDNARLYRDAQNAIALRDQFLSIASHELKTPLTGLAGFAQILERRTRREKSLNERDQHTLELIVQQAFRLNRLITGVLDVSRIQAGQLSIERAAVDINMLAERVAEEARATLEKHHLLAQPSPTPVIVQGDELRLEQVLQNLVQNAIKYSPAGGDITLRVERRDNEVCISVSDQGIGIPAEALPQLFDRFYRASNAEERGISGMGIGLYVVKEIVNLHGGTLDVQSAPGQGSRFTACLPLS